MIAGGTHCAITNNKNFNILNIIYVYQLRLGHLRNALLANSSVASYPDERNSQDQLFVHAQLFTEKQNAILGLEALCKINSDMSNRF